MKRRGRERTPEVPPYSTAAPTETISASIPCDLAALVRSHAGKRQFSQFVTRALKREIVRQSRLELVAEFARHGVYPDPGYAEKLRRIMDA